MNLLSFALGYALADSSKGPYQPVKPVPMTEADWIMLAAIMAVAVLLAAWGGRKAYRMMTPGLAVTRPRGRLSPFRTTEGDNSQFGRIGGVFG